MRMSLFSRSSRPIFDRPLGLVPVTFILNVRLVMWVSSLRITCPYHDNRFCVRTDLIGVTFAILSLMVSFLIRSFQSIFSIFMSMVCKRYPSCLRSAQHSLPYTIACLTNVLYSLLFSFTGTFLSLISPHRFLHRDQATFISPSTSFPHPPLQYITEPRYLKLLAMAVVLHLTSLHPFDENSVFDWLIINPLYL